MREITQSGDVMYRMVWAQQSADDLRKEGGPMELLRASAVALSFVGLAVLVGMLSLVVGVVR